MNQRHPYFTIDLCLDDVHVATGLNTLESNLQTYTHGLDTRLHARNPGSDVKYGNQGSASEKFSHLPLT